MTIVTVPFPLYLRGCSELTLIGAPFGDAEAADIAGLGVAPNGLAGPGRRPSTSRQ